MKTKSFIKQVALAVCALLAFALTGRAQLLGGSDTGATAPTPGLYDISQLLLTGDTQPLPGVTGLNQFYDNTVSGGSGASGNVGGSFTTGSNPSGYVMKSLSLKFGGACVSGGFAGGGDTSLDPGYVITLFQLSGTGLTNATPIYTNTLGTITGSGNTGCDWINMTGFNVTLASNTVYAWTILSTGYDDLGYATGAPYGGGQICEIKPTGGTVTYFAGAANYSAAFNVGLSLVPNPLTGSDSGATAPTPGAHDISQLSTNGDSIALPIGGALNQYYDNTSYPSYAGGPVGGSFTTGANPSGYVMNSLALKFGGGGGTGVPGYSGGADATQAPGYVITLFQLSGTGLTNATPISTNTLGTNRLTGSANTGADWITMNGFNLTLISNTTYAYTIFSTGYDDLGYGTNNPAPYSGGQICAIQNGGGTVTYFPTASNYSAAFDISLTLSGFPAVGAPVASQNPVYALSPITLTDTATSPAGALTNVWQTNSDLTGGLGGVWASVPGSTGLTTLPVTPANLDPSGPNYTIDYRMVVSNAAGAATSGPVALVVEPASAPVINVNITPPQLVTYVGATATFTASFVGTTPLTNQWQANTNVSYVNLTGQTNGTLTLTNVQLSASGSYQLLEENSQGSTPSSAATLTVQTGPAGPPSSDKEAYQIYTNSPYAYWRLNETTQPGEVSYPVLAYDYSGHGFYATYGLEVSTDLPGPQPPAFPGFTSDELAVATFAAADGFVNVPPLNLNTNTVTFVAWIFPTGGQVADTGLLMDRNGGDAAGFGFGGTLNSGMAALGYTWNTNSSATWGWNSGLFPIVNAWNFVAYVVTPTNTTVYLGLTATTNLLLAVNAVTNDNEPFSNGSDLGSDPQTIARNFSGLMTEAAVWNRSLSGSDVLSLFLTGMGSSGIAPAPPLTLPTLNVFSGGQAQYNGTASGSPTINYQWKSAPTGSGTFTNVPNSGGYSGATSSTLTIASANTNDALYYEVVAQNPIGTVTSGVGQVTVTVLPTNGQWTQNFQLTNDTLNFGTSTSGGGQYTGHGVLGTGTYWNTYVNTAGAFGFGTFDTATDFRDDGATETGIFGSLNGADDSTLPVPAASSAIQTLLDQFVYAGTAFTFTGVPDGYYNVAIYCVNGGFEDGTVSLTVNATNEVQTATAVNDQDGFFSSGGNTELFTNVEVLGGTLVVDYSATGAENPGVNGAQLQLVSYVSSVSDVMLTNVFTNNTLQLSWPEGVLQTATNLLGPWTDITDPSPVTVNTTNKMQFFRLKVE